jgi:outer membrane murein-binding lipoprotein Lpp
MTSRPSWKIAILTAAASLLLGCAQSGPMFGGGTKVGTLKTSLSHLEYQNEQMRKEIALLKSENRRIEDQMAQVEAENGELTARLDDARNVMRQNGDSPQDAPPKTLPAGRSSKPLRKPPFAQIPGRIDPIPPGEPDENLPIDPFDVPSTRQSDEFGPQGRVEDHDHWLPIARGTSNVPAQVR